MYTFRSFKNETETVEIKNYDKRKNSRIYMRWMAKRLKKFSGHRRFTKAPAIQFKSHIN